MLFVDSADVKAIREMLELGIVHGVTTNPLFMPRTPEHDQNFTLRDILKVTESNPYSVKVCVQLTAEGWAEMVAEAEALHSAISTGLVYKVPFSKEGLRACRHLTSSGLGVNMTSIMSVQQAYLSAQAGAEYVSLFYGRIADGGTNPRAVIFDTKRLLKDHSFPTEIIAGSLRQVADVMAALGNGADIATVKPEILRKMMEHPLTEQVNGEFRAAIEKNNALYQDPARAALAVGHVIANAEKAHAEGRT